MVKTQLLSRNLVTVINELMENQKLAKYIYYGDSEPLEQSDLTDIQGALFLKKLFPTPFALPSETTTDGKAIDQLHVYYGKGDLSEVAVEDVILYFDIVVSKSLWLCSVTEPDPSTKIIRKQNQIRPYEIMNEIIETLNGRSIDTLGEIKFRGFRHIYVNQEIDAVQLTATITTFAKG